MKLLKIIALFLSLYFLNNVNGQNLNKKALLNIEDEKITVEEFLAMYQENRITTSGIKENAIEKQLELYINFRLKTLEAKALGLDTLQHLKDELVGYRKQLAKPYFYNQQVNDQILLEAYQRLLKDIRVSHILVLCENYSEDRGTKLRSGILPSYKSNNMIPDFYLPIADIDTIGYYSEPVQTMYGWHIIKFIHQDKIGSFEEEKSKLMAQLSNDTRSRKSKEKVIQRIKDKHSCFQYFNRLLITNIETSKTIKV